MKETVSKQNLIQMSDELLHEQIEDVHDPCDKPLSSVEKKFLLYADRGDCARVIEYVQICYNAFFMAVIHGFFRIINEYSDKPQEFDINCVDPLNRTALITAIENENVELIKILLEGKIDVKVS